MLLNDLGWYGSIALDTTLYHNNNEVKIIYDIDIMFNVPISMSTCTYTLFLINMFLLKFVNVK